MTEFDNLLDPTAISAERIKELERELAETRKILHGVGHLLSLALISIPEQRGQEVSPDTVLNVLASALMPVGLMALNNSRLCSSYGGIVEAIGKAWKSGPQALKKEIEAVRMYVIYAMKHENESLPPTPPEVGH